MYKFKVGDIVRCLQSSGSKSYSFKKGALYKVTSLNIYEKKLISISTLSVNEGHYNGWSPDFFEPYTVTPNSKWF